MFEDLPFRGRGKMNYPISAPPFKGCHEKYYYLKFYSLKVFIKKTECSFPAIGSYKIDSEFQSAPLFYFIHDSNKLNLLNMEKIITLFPTT
jgi:hypothetical protein